MADLTARALYAASIVGTLLYGMYLILAGINLHFLLKHRSKQWKQRFLIGYFLVIFFLSAAFFGFMCQWDETMFIESDIGTLTIPQVRQFSVPGEMCSIISVWLADSLLAYRVYVVWDRHLYTIILPVFILLADFALGTCLIITTISPTRSKSLNNIDFNKPFWSISVAFDLLMSSLISGRLLWHHLSSKRALRYSGNDGTSYFSVSSAFMESAGCYSFNGLLYIILLAANSPLQYVFAMALRTSAFIAPNLIILRVALGIAVTNQTTEAQTRELVFHVNSPHLTTFIATGTTTSRHTTRRQSEDCSVNSLAFESESKHANTMYKPNTSAR